MLLIGRLVARRAALAVTVIALVVIPDVPGFEPVLATEMALGGALVNAWADFDGDGKVDLFVGFNGTPNRLYRNTGTSFVDAAKDAGVADARATRAAAWGDFDADGDADLLVGFAPGAGGVLRLYRNEQGRFTDITATAGIAMERGAVRQPVWVDFDGDGDLDLFVAFRDRRDALFLNERGTFTDVARERGLTDSLRSVGAVWFDYDDDADLDVLVANMDGDPNTLYRNDAGMFSLVVPATSVSEWGGRMPRDSTQGTVRPCTADVDNDGRLDLFFANYGRNGLFLNRGGGRFEDVSEKWGVAIDGRYDTCAFEDFDNDGFIDLYVNGTITGGTSYRDYLFRNTGARFEDVTPANIAALNADHGAEWMDFDRDGDADLALTGSAASGMHHVLRNMLGAAPRAQSLSIRVVDSAGHDVRTGAAVRVYKAGTKSLIAMRSVDAGSGYNAQNVGPLHVGLGAATRVDVEVTYSAGGKRFTARADRIDPAQYRGRDLTVRVFKAR
jgi:hypothetical protein